MLEECREDLRAYLKAHPKPIATPDLLKAVMQQAEAERRRMSTLDYGAAYVYVTRREAYCAVLWSMRANGEVLTRNGDWLQC